MLRDPDVTRAGSSVLKVRGTNDCGRGIEGSGFLYADGPADDQRPRRRRGRRPAGGRRRRHHRTPTVVFYDPDLDVAVLEFDSGAIPALPFTDTDEPAQPKDPIAILGYPQDGPFDIETGRIRAKQTLRSPDIYGDGAVIRDVFSIRGLVRPGNSGGPIVDSAGAGGRRGVRGVGDRRRHRLRAHRRPGPRGGRRGQQPSDDRAVDTERAVRG